jgi:hypothetical protein
MVPVMSLWLPILLGAVLVFLASSIIHMALPWHKNDFGKVPDEDAVMAALRPFGIPPGEYVMPRPASGADMKTEEYQGKLKAGPVAFINVFPNQQIAMGSSLIQWFLYSVVVGALAAYVTGRAVGPGAAYLDVFRFVAISAFLGYSLALAQASIWYKRSWTVTLKSMIDGLIYALLTAGVFGWLWPV